MLLLADKDLIHEEDASIYNDPTQDIDSAYNENKSTFEGELLPVLLALLHQWEIENKSTPLYARTRKLLSLRADLQKWISHGATYLEEKLTQENALQPHVEELQRFYALRFPGVAFKVPDSPKFPLLLLDGKTIKECLQKSGEGFAQRIIKHYQNGENVYDAVMKAWESGLDYQHRLISTHFLYRQRIAEVLFYKANPAIFKYVMFSAIMDGRTSKVCRGLNGKIYDINNPSIPIPPLHPRCRSRLVPFNNLTTTWK